MFNMNMNMNMFNMNMNMMRPFFRPPFNMMNGNMMRRRRPRRMNMFFQFPFPNPNNPVMITMNGPDTIITIDKDLLRSASKNNVRKLEATSTQTPKKSGKTFVTKFVKKFVPRDPAGRLEGTPPKAKRYPRLNTKLNEFTLIGAPPKHHEAAKHLPSKGETKNGAPVNDKERGPVNKGFPTQKNASNNNVRKLDEATSTQTPKKSGKTHTFVTKFVKKFVPRDPAGRLEVAPPKSKKYPRLNTKLNEFTLIGAPPKHEAAKPLPPKGETKNGAPVKKGPVNKVGLPTKEIKEATNAKANNSSANPKAATKVPVNKNKVTNAKANNSAANPKAATKIPV